MAMVTSALGLERERQLQEMFPEPIRLLLCFKGKQHGFSYQTFCKSVEQSRKCLILVYLKSGIIRGVYLSSGRLPYNQPQSDEETFLLEINPHKKETFPVVNPNGVVDRDFQHLCLGKCVKFYDNKKTLCVDLSAADDHYSVPGWDEEIQAPYVDIEVHEVLDHSKDDTLFMKPWRKAIWSDVERQSLTQKVISFEPACQSIKRVRVLLLGPKGAGKSCFVNSVRSLLYGRVTHLPLINSTTQDGKWKLKSYDMQSDRGKTQLALTFVDAPAVGPGVSSGMGVCNIQTILNGHAQEGYKFEPNVAIDPTCKGYRHEPTINEKIHCVFFVLNACHVLTPGEELKQTLLQLQNEVSDLDIPQLVLLTHVDKVCSAVQEDVKNVFLSSILKDRMEKAADLVGLPVSYLLPIKNYSSEKYINNDVDILLLNAVETILNAVDDLFDSAHPMVQTAAAPKNSPEKPVTV